MKKFTLSLASMLLMVLAISLESCNNEEPTPSDLNAAGQVEISATITENTTWTADKKYLLIGNIYVQAPAELTIEAGTVIFGDKVTKGALIVSRGAKIHAVGTATKPIIFTSNGPKTFRNY